MSTATEFVFSMMAIDGYSVEDLQEMLPQTEAQLMETRSALEDHLIYNLDLVGQFHSSEATAQQQCFVARVKKIHAGQPGSDMMSNIRSTIALIDNLRRDCSELGFEIDRSRYMIDLNHQLAALERKIAEQQLIVSLRALQKLEGDVSSMHASLRSQYIGNFSKRLRTQQEAIRIRAEHIWSSAVKIDKGKTISICKTLELSEAVQILEVLETMDAKIQKFSQAVLKGLIQPILLEGLRARVEHDILVLSDSEGVVGLEGVGLCLVFLMEYLPPTIYSALKPGLQSTMWDTIRDQYLPLHLPTHSQSFTTVQDFMQSIVVFEQSTKDLGFLPMVDTNELICSVSQIWLRNYKSTILEECRRLVLSWTGVIRITEQSETVSGNSLQRLPSLASTTAESDTSIGLNNPGDEDDGADEWNMDWDIEEDPSNTSPGIDRSRSPDTRQMLDESQVPHSRSTEPLAPQSSMIVTTKFAISTIPQSLLILICKCQDDARALEEGKNFLAPAAVQLYQMESDILNCYRALSSLLIKTLGYPRMIIYNDCIFLAHKVSEPDMIRRFGETFYSAEVEEKQTQIRIIMQGANEFVSCTVPSQNQICYNCIQEALDLLRRLHERYEGQLYRTTMFTALGTLVEAAISTMMEAILNMTDISAAESTELASMGDALTVSEELFQTAEDPMPLAAMWCPSWFKFKLLLDILEAKLDYILELWTTGHLIDFSSQEICDLIKALFSDTVKRRSALETISVGVPQMK